MAKLNEQFIASEVKAKGADVVSNWVKEGLVSGEIKMEEISSRDLAKQFICFKDGTPMGEQAINFIMSEAAGDSVNMAAFSNIMQQYYYNSVMEVRKYPMFAISEALKVTPSHVLQVEEKFPQVSNLGDFEKPIGEAQPYPMVGLNEEWINSPIQETKGGICPITRQAIANDRLGLVRERGNKVGEGLYLGREKQALDTIINIGGATPGLTVRNSQPYRYCGEAKAVWQSSDSASPFYINVKASNELVDATQISAAEKVLAAIRDPKTREPFVHTGQNILLCTPDYRWTAQRIANQMQYRTGTISTSNVVMITGADLPMPFTVVSSQLFADRLAAAGLSSDYWVLGDIANAFHWVQDLPVTITEADQRSGLAFSHDILYQFKASRCESCAPWEPRYVVRSKASS